MVKISSLVQIKKLKKYFPIATGIFSKVTGSVMAVDDISFDIHTGETLGLVGESGCGKSTTGRLIARLIKATEGEVLFDSKNIFRFNREEMRQLRRDTQLVFQDPYASLNPRMKICDIIGEPLVIHKIARGREKTRKVQEILELVGLSKTHFNRYPHEFSGGQRQRIGIARAIALNPKLIICDEPVSSLDVSIQAHIINLLNDLQSELKLTYLFISHDLSVVKHISDRVGVMYLGQIVELANTGNLYTKPLHPYSEALLSAIPIVNPSLERKRKRIILGGDVASPANPPKGCRFHTRCLYKRDNCEKEIPDLTDVGNDHYVRCHLYAELDLVGI